MMLLAIWFLDPLYGTPYALFALRAGECFISCSVFTVPSFTVWESPPPATSQPKRGRWARAYSDSASARPSAFVAQGENSSSTRVSFRSFDE